MADIKFKASNEPGGNQTFEVSAEANAEMGRLLKDAAVGAESHNLEAVNTIAQLLTEPIITVVDYNEVFGDVLQKVSVAIGDDMSYPLDVYDSQAFTVSADGEVLANRIPGILYTSPTPFRIETGFEVHFDDLAKARFDLVGRRVVWAAQELARKRDTAVHTALNTAASSLSGHVILESSGSLTKNTVDSVFRAAASIGYQITAVRINSADVLAMRQWSNNPFQETAPFAEQFAKVGYYGEYGGAQWQASTWIQGRIAGSQHGEVYFIAAPNMTGFQWEIGGLRAMSGTQDRQRLAWWSWDQAMAVTIVNAYAIFKVVIVQ